jgi:energy-coupling factor transport system ATP-binding protein
MSFISLKNVSFEYPGGFRAVDSVTIDIERGENIAIMGRNGAGKTTLVKLCNRLLCPTEGDVFIGGKNTRKHSTAEISRIVGYVFQNPDDQIFNSTVEKEVEFGPKMMKLPDGQIKRQMDDALEITGLSHERNENPYNLPFSRRKFISIAAVIAMNTEAVILDEPAAGQDLAGTRRLRDIIKTLLKRDKTLITISHDMEFAAENFSRLILMADKRVIADGKPEHIFWNFEALQKARLTQPCVSRICRRLDIGGNIIHLDDAVEALMRRAVKKMNA